MNSKGMYVVVNKGFKSFLKEMRWNSVDEIKGT